MTHELHGQAVADWAARNAADPLGPALASIKRERFRRAMAAVIGSVVLSLVTVLAATLAFGHTTDITLQGPGASKQITVIANS